MWMGIASASAAYLPVDLADLLDPSPPVCVLKLKNVLQRPVKVIRDVGYLLVEAIQGVA